MGGYKRTKGIGRGYMIEDSGEMIVGVRYAVVGVSCNIVFIYQQDHAPFFRLL